MAITKVPGNVQVDTARVRMSRIVDPADAANIADNLQRQIYSLAQLVSALMNSASSSSGGGFVNGEWQIPLVTINRTLTAAITTTTAATCILNSDPGLADPFLMDLASGEAVRVTAHTGASVTAMDRGWNGSTAATQTNGSAAVITTATPDISKGPAQMISAASSITQLAPINVTVPTEWTMDIIQDATGSRSILPSGSYLGIGDDTNGDPRKWDGTPTTRYVVRWRTQADGNTIPMGGNGGPYPLT